MKLKNINNRIYNSIIDHNRIIVNILLPAFCVIFLLLIGIGSVSNLADTNDEKFHLTRGVMLLNTGDLRINQHHPYLFNLIAAVPTLFDQDLEIPSENAKAWVEADKDALSFGFVQINGGRDGFSQQVLFFPRVFIFLVSLVLLVFSYFLTIRVFGPIPAIVFMLFTSLSATVVAHSTLVTTDMASMLLIYLVCLVIYQKVSEKAENERLNWKDLLGISFMMLLMLLSKYTAVVVILPLMLMIFWHEYKRVRSLEKSWYMGILKGTIPVIITSVFILILLTAAYKFQFATMLDMAYGNQAKIDANLDSMSHIKDRNQTIGEIAEYFYKNVPVPFPQYVNGFYENVLKHNAYGHRTFFMGEFSNGGWLSYFPVAFLLKEPVGTLLLVISSIIAGAVYYYKRRPMFNIYLALLFFIPTLLAFFSITSSINLGIRHILPIFPFIFLAIGLLIDRVSDSKNSILIALIVTTFFLINLVSLIGAYPHYIPYFNFIAGGSENGYNYLRDSNFDWDQSLLYQLDYVEQNPDKKITLDPKYIYGYDYIIIGKELLYGDPEKTKEIENIAILRENIEEGEARIIKDIAVVDLLIRVTPYEWEEDEE